MKKTLIIIATILLFATLFVSCADDKTVFKSISQSSPKSKYGCTTYIGTYGSRHYALTNNKGIISFTLLEEGKSASDIKRINAGNHKTIDYTYLSDSTLYCLDRDGNLFDINLSDGTVSDNYTGNYCLLCDGYVLTTPDSNTVSNLYAITDLNTEILTDVWSTVISGHYIRTDTALYNIKNLNTKVATIEKGTTVSNVIVVNGTTYIVLLKSTVYNIYKSTDLSTAIESLSDEPTASFAIDNTHIAYKTKSDIEKLTITPGETPSYDIEYGYDDGWASNICTSETEIYEFAEINGKYYGLNGNGGMMYIDPESTTASIQIFNE